MIMGDRAQYIDDCTDSEYDTDGSDSDYDPTTDPNLVVNWEIEMHDTEAEFIELFTFHLCNRDRLSDLQKTIFNDMLLYLIDTQ